MKKEQAVLLAYWWEKLCPLRQKFARETLLGSYEKDDLEQECFFQLQKALERYNSQLGVPFESYYKVVLHGWRSNQNKMKRNQELTVGEEIMYFLEDERINIEQEVETKLLAEEVMRKLDELEERMQRIIIAYYLQNKQIKEIASELGLSYKSVEAKKKQALNYLKVMLE